MNLIPRNPYFDFDDLFDAWRPLRGIEPAGDGFRPRVDIADKDDHFEVTAELPGVKKEDLKVTLANGVLTIEAETRQDEETKEEGKLVRRERRYGKFTRSFNLGSGVSEADIKAGYADGILTLEVPKAAEPEPVRRQIEVN